MTEELTKQKEKFLITNSATGIGRFADVGVFNDGGFVVVWEGKEPGGTSDIFAQLYDRDGNKSGNEIEIFSGAYDQYDPSLAVIDGDEKKFVVAWSHYNVDTGDYYIRAREYSEHMPKDDDFDVLRREGCRNTNPSVGSYNGGYVVVWQSEGSAEGCGDGSGSGIQARVYDTMNYQETEIFRVNSKTQNSQMFPSVTKFNPYDQTYFVSWVSAEKVISREFRGSMPSTDEANISSDFTTFCSSNDFCAPSAVRLSNDRYAVLYVDGGRYILANFYAALDRNLTVSDPKPIIRSAGNIIGSPVLDAFLDDSFVVVWKTESNFIYIQKFDHEFNAQGAAITLDDSPGSGNVFANPTVRTSNNGSSIAVWAVNKVGSVDTLYGAIYETSTPLDPATKDYSDSEKPIDMDFRAPGYENVRTVIGSMHNDTITGNFLANNIYGGDGHDTISGGGTQYSFGSCESIVLANADHLYGGGEYDDDGDNGRDTFVIPRISGISIIEDFEPGDTIDIRAFDGYRSFSDREDGVKEECNIGTYAIYRLGDINSGVIHDLVLPESVSLSDTDFMFRYPITITENKFVCNVDERGPCIAWGSGVAFVGVAAVSSLFIGYKYGKCCTLAGKVLPTLGLTTALFATSGIVSARHDTEVDDEFHFNENYDVYYTSLVIGFLFGAITIGVYSYLHYKEIQRELANENNHGAEDAHLVGAQTQTHVSIVSV